MTPSQFTTTWLRTARPLTLLVLMFPAAAVGQIRSITASFDYGFALSTQTHVQSASAIGGAVDLRMALADELALGLSIGYASYGIEQEEELAWWNWNFWNDRYYPKIQSDMRADPNLSVQLGTVQSMNTIPVTLSLLYSLALGEELILTPRVAAGVSFYTRKLYVDETWTKQYPAAAYTLTYGLRNFAPDKKGEVVFGALGCDITYRLFSDVDLTAGAHYRRYLSSSSGFDAFPFSDECLLKVGLTFLY